MSRGGCLIWILWYIPFFSLLPALLTTPHLVSVAARTPGFPSLQRSTTEAVPSANAHLAYSPFTPTHGHNFVSALTTSAPDVVSGDTSLHPSSTASIVMKVNAVLSNTSWSYTPASLVLSASASSPEAPVSTAAGSFNLMIGDDVPAEGIITISTLLTSVTFTKAAIAAGQDCTLYARSAGQLQIRTVRAYSAGAQELLACVVTGITVPFDNAAGRADTSDPYVLKADAVQVQLPSGDAGVTASGNITLRSANATQYWFNFVPVDRVVTRGALEATRQLRVSFDVYVYAVLPTNTAIQQTVTAQLSCVGLTVETPARSLSVTSPYRVTKASTPLRVLFNVANAAYYPFPVGACLTVTSTTGSIARAGTATVALTAFTRPFDFAFYPVAAAVADPAAAASEAALGNTLVDVGFELALHLHSPQTAGWNFSVTLLSPLTTRIDFSSGPVTVLSTQTAGYASVTCTPMVANATMLLFLSCGVVDAVASGMFAPRAIRFGASRMTYTMYQALFSTYS